MQHYLPFLSPPDTGDLETALTVFKACHSLSSLLELCELDSGSGSQVAGGRDGGEKTSVWPWAVRFREKGVVLDPVEALSLWQQYAMSLLQFPACPSQGTYIRVLVHVYTRYVDCLTMLHVQYIHIIYTV